MTTPVLPDSKQIAIDLLQSALGSTARVVGELPDSAGFDAELPLVRILRIGGTAGLRGWADPSAIDRPRFSVDCYALAKPALGAAMRLALRVRGEWELLPGQATADGIVTATSEETGPQDRPEEPNTGVRRVGMTLGMSVRPPRTVS
ncbi:MULTISPECIES: hypothetical protein [unclassified Streptomyces]|uniref:hypothetical protein n=1 Tax=unclassified Streptomyces TaxID=2593676 RepID=UPI000851C56A|nr:MULTISPECIES: hypothetical protein [unclassified Streptomyces]